MMMFYHRCLNSRGEIWKQAKDRYFESKINNSYNTKRITVDLRSQIDKIISDNKHGRNAPDGKRQAEQNSRLVEKV